MIILQLLDTLRRGGKERQFIELIRGLDKSEFQIHIIVLEKREDGYYEEAKKLAANFQYLIRKFRWDLFLIYDIIKYIKNHKIQTIQVWDGMCAFYGYFAAKFTKIKFINYSIQEADPRITYRHIIQRLMLKLSKNILANQYAGLKVYGVEKKGKVIYNGLDFKRFENLVRTKNEKFIIGIVANLTDYKDYYTFFDAIKILTKDFTNFEVHMVGWGKLAKTYIAYAEKLGIMEYLKFLGRLSDVEKHVINFDIGVLSSYKEKGEGLSNSVIEYMACGVPPVITDIGAAREIIDDGITGLLFEAGNSQDLANKIEYLFKNKDIRNKMGEKAKEEVFKKFGYERYIQEMEEYYDKVMGLER